ncbi:MAG: hypothetical protein ACK400_15245, partial [Pseudanabaena sp.]
PNTILRQKNIKNFHSKNHTPRGGAGLPPATHLLVLYQFTKVWQHFYELKTKPSKGFKSTKWLRHFVLWY